MKTRIYVYGLTLITVIAFFIYWQVWKYNREKEILSELNQKLNMDELRFATEEAYFAQSAFNAVMANTSDKDEMDAAEKEMKAKHEAALDDDRRQIEEFSREHGF
jgi:hypothetical protein